MRFALPCLLVLSVSSSALAQRADSRRPTVDLQLFQPTPGANNFFTTESGDVNSHLGISVGLNLNYANKPLAVQILREDGDEDAVGPIVGYRIDAVLLAALGLFDYGELGIAMPMVMQGGQDERAFQGAGVDVGAALQGFTQGDLRVVPKVRFLRLADGAFSAAVVGTVIVPTAGKTPYASENNIVIAPSLALSTQTSLIRGALDLGYRLRDRTRIEPVPGQVLLTVDDEVFAKAALAVDLKMGQGAPMELVAELFGHTPAVNAFAWNAKSDIAKKKQGARTSLEADFGLRWVLAEHFILTGGVGLGAKPQGYGQPLPRVFAGLTWYSGQFGIADADKDGVPDSLDACPDKKEDKDDFEDGDGCPELDNDKDNVPDEDDQCPNEKEDDDGLADQDGCPEADVDDDGVLDENDKCQGEAEDKDGFEDEDGCPDFDNDKDGIADKVDKCPNEAEDVDGFQDSDGCPDNDNDGDGLPDLGDLCPNNAEDIDGVADDDGCPEDNDGDGILDQDDKCPNEAELYNGIEDEDGCPEKIKAKSLVNVTDDKIEIKETVYFKTNSATILPKSFNLLDQVASVLKNYKHLTKVRVEGHTDSVGPRKRNLKLSQDRADSVRQYLLDKGIDPKRLVAEGFGPDKPIASNKTGRGREQNRRVEFVIAERKALGTDVSDAKPAGEPVIEMEGLGGDSDIEMKMDLGPTPTPPEEPKVEPPPAEEPKGKKKGKGKKKDADKPADPEIEFNF